MCQIGMTDSIAKGQNLLFDARNLPTEKQQQQKKKKMQNRSLTINRSTVHAFIQKQAGL